MNVRLFRLAQDAARKQLQGQNYTQDEFDNVADAVLRGWYADMSLENDMEDTDCIESGRDNCDDWGTGEGMYHGRI